MHRRAHRATTPRRRGGHPAVRAARGTAAAAALVLLAAGCGDEVTAGPAASSPAAASSPVAVDATGATPTDDPAAAATAPATTAPGAPAPEEEASATAPTPGGDDAPAGAGTGPSEERATGAGLSVVDVRTGRHDGYDRVVVELAGDPSSVPGWYAHYVDEPSQQGSGEPVDVAGDRSLEVVVRGLGYPFDTGQEEFLGSVEGQGTALVREVAVGGVFEGQAQVHVGLDAPADAPYRVTRLSDPPRVVVDLLG